MYKIVRVIKWLFLTLVEVLDLDSIKKLINLVITLNNKALFVFLFSSKMNWCRLLSMVLAGVYILVYEILFNFLKVTADVYFVKFDAHG